MGTTFPASSKQEGALSNGEEFLFINFPFYPAPYAVVTPLRKAASYEQRKTNLGSSLSL